jgi:hypothetical protein
MTLRGSTKAGAMARSVKLSVSIEKAELEWARREARRTGKTLSAVMTEALREQRRLEAMDRLLKKLGADKITDEQIARLRAEVYGLR